MKANFKVREDLAWWSYGDEKYEPGSVHEVSGEDAIKMVAAAESAGSLVEVEYDAGAEKLAGKSVQSQADSELVQRKAMEDGAWAVGNAMMAEIEPDQIEIGSES